MCFRPSTGQSIEYFVFSICILDSLRKFVLYIDQWVEGGGGGKEEHKDPHHLRTDSDYR